MQKRTGMVLEGRALLQAHLDATKQSAYAFARLHRLDRLTVKRLLKGERTWVSVDLAWLIQRATAADIQVLRRRREETRLLPVPWTAWLSPGVAAEARRAA